MAAKYPKWPQNIPNGRKMFQMAANYPKMAINTPIVSKGPPKYTHNGILA
jgi:hypothetical protein